MPVPSSRLLTIPLLSIVLAACAIGAAACGGRKMFVPPAGPGEPLQDASAVWDAATKDCRDLRSLVSSLRVSGHVGDARVWPLTVEAAVLSNQSIYLGATASGRPIFLLTGSNARATLWLRTDDRAVTGPLSEILRTLMGVSLGIDDMLNVLSGCPARGGDGTQAMRHGALATIESGAGRAFLEQRAGEWNVRAIERTGFTAEFVPPGRSVPQDIWLWSGAGTTPAALHLTVTERDLNREIPADFFRVPEGAQAARPMTLEELASMWKNRVPSPENLPCPAP